MREAKPITIGDIYSALGNKTLDFVIREDRARKHEKTLHGTLTLAVIGNFREGATKYVVMYRRLDAEYQPVCQWREEFPAMDGAVDLFNKMLNGEKEDDWY